MIVKMKKISVLCLESDRARTLDALAELGVVHIQHVRPPEGADVEKARARLAHVERVSEVLAAFKAAPADAAVPEHLAERPVGEIVDEIWSLIKRRKELDEQYEALAHECRRVAPFGDFDPDAIEKLEDAGVFVRLYFLGPEQPLPPAPPNAVLQVLQRGKSGIYFVVIARGAAPTMPALLVRPPEIPLAELRRKLEHCEQERSEVIAKLTAFSAARRLIAEHAAALEEEVAWAEARAGMGAKGVLCYLTGFIPEESAAAVRNAARQHGWGLLITEPAEDDIVPTCIRNPRWVRPIQAVFDMIGILPGYREVDISAAFLGFLSLFFAILVGDAGYGVLFLGLTWLLRRKLPALPPHYLRLLQIMSICTIGWGILTNVYFGVQPPALRFLAIPWLDSKENVMLLCFYIGAIHLTVAHVWNILRFWPAPGAFAQAGWICTTWAMFFLARKMVLGHVFPPVMLWVLAVGVVLIVLFMTPPRQLKNEWFNHVMLPLNLVSNFVDVISYLRLFAVGAASLAVATSFNAMAASLGLPKILAGLVGALILFVGHGLNILLAAMGVLVHGVRLNTLEFSSHIGMQWSGVGYRPFLRRARPASRVAADMPAERKQ